MSKITYEQKIETIERYAKRPMSASDPEVFAAIKVDVVKANSKGVRRAADPGPELHLDNSLYNTCMGVYRSFLKVRDSHLVLDGIKAKKYKEAMDGIINYVRKFQQSNGKASDDDAVLKAVQFIFGNWDRLNDFHKNRLTLPDIYSKIEEILPMIKNGYSKKSAATNQVNDLENSIKAKRQ